MFQVDHYIKVYRTAQLYKDFKYVFSSPLCNRDNLAKQLNEINNYLCAGSADCIFKPTFQYCKVVPKNERVTGCKRHVQNSASACKYQ